MKKRSETTLTCRTHIEADAVTQFNVAHRLGETSIIDYAIAIEDSTDRIEFEASYEDALALEKTARQHGL